VSWLSRIIRTGRIAEPEPEFPDAAAGVATGDHGSLQLRHVDAGSCNGCEIEIGQAFGPVYDAERYGARLVASPRHADGLLVTGVVTRNMEQPLRNTLAATPQPRIVLAVGDCACNRGVFANAYGVVGAVSDVVPVDVQVPGCPPAPAEIVAALRSVTRR
jgi:Ni,Fe-hydrogenase III small subunit